MYYNACPGSGIFSINCSSSFNDHAFACFLINVCFTQMGQNYRANIDNQLHCFDGLIDSLTTFICKYSYYRSNIIHVKGGLSSRREQMQDTCFYYSITLLKYSGITLKLYYVVHYSTITFMWYIFRPILATFLNHINFESP